MGLGSRVRPSLVSLHYRLTAFIALLRAMADKMVPGIPHSTRIAILQQTDAESHNGLSMNVEGQISSEVEKSVLEYVLSSDSHRNEVTRKMNSKDYVQKYLTINNPQFFQEALKQTTRYSPYNASEGSATKISRGSCL